MELSVQDWMIGIGALLIVGVLLDAFRRYRNERRNPIRMSRSRFGMGGGFGADASDAVAPAAEAELPNGGARVVRPRELPEGDLDLLPQPARPTRREPRIGTEPGVTEPGENSPVVGQPVSQDPVFPGTGATAGSTTATAVLGHGDQQVIVLRVIARDEAGFAGEALQRILNACDVRFGDMNIFHRHELEKGQGAVQFSVLNATEPGSFDIANIHGFHTPGLSLFMRLPGPRKPLEAFDCMLETARVIARHLDGELRDESNSVCTQQTVEHCRERIREFVHRSRRR